MHDNLAPPLLYFIFIGGAADKESFLWGNVKVPFNHSWPHHTMLRVMNSFQSKLQREWLKHSLPVEWLTEQSRFEYLSYTEVFFDSLKDKLPYVAEDAGAQLCAEVSTDEKLASLLANIGEKTHVFIIGHSLGGWNGAHLSSILAQLGKQPDYLVTLDPVGLGNHDITFMGYFMKQARIYRHPPQPSALHWINIRGHRISMAEKQLSGSLEDWVAWAGGQWLIEQRYPDVGVQINETTPIAHKKALSMLSWPLTEGESSCDQMIAAAIAIAQGARPTPRRKLAARWRWLKKLLMIFR